MWKYNLKYFHVCPSVCPPFCLSVFFLFVFFLSVFFLSVFFCRSVCLYVFFWLSDSRSVSLSVCMFVCLYVCLSICMYAFFIVPFPVYMSDCLSSVCLSVYQHVCLSIFMSIHPSMSSPVHLSVCLFIHPTICSFVHLSACLSVKRFTILYKNLQNVTGCYVILNKLECFSIAITVIPGLCCTIKHYRFIKYGKWTDG